MKKRKFADLVSRCFGFCIDATFYPVSEKKSAYFQACDSSVVLCDSEHANTDSAIPFIHHPLPMELRGINLRDFVRFLNNKPIKSLDLDFAEWANMLAFLGCDQKFTSRLSDLGMNVADGSMPLGPTAVLSAWKHFKHRVSAVSQQDKIPKTLDNLEFFIDHKMDVLLPCNFPFPKLFLPDELVSMLHPQKLALCGGKIVAKDPHCPAMSYMLDTLEQFSTVDQSKLYNILIRNGYILNCFPDTYERKYVYAFAPENTSLENVLIQNRKCTTHEELVFKKLHYPFQFCVIHNPLTGPTLLCSAQCYHIRTHGKVAPKVGTVKLMVIYRAMGYETGPEFTEEQLNEVVSETTKDDKLLRARDPATMFAYSSVAIQSEAEFSFG
jgi:hypothetical protein